MKQWARLETDTLCGGCGQPLAKGATVQRWTLVNVTRALIRCEMCVGEKGPAFPEPVRALPAQPAPRMTPLAELIQRADWKQKAAGE